MLGVKVLFYGELEIKVTTLEGHHEQYENASLEPLVLCPAE